MPGPTDFELLATDIRRQPDLLATRSAQLRHAAETVAAQVPARPSRIYLVGCGDSLNVGYATQFAWEAALGIPVEAVPAMTFSRYMVDGAPDDAMVVVLSQSGTVVRVIEAARRARGKGLVTVTITGTAGSPLANEPATTGIVTDFPKLGFVPGTTSYALNLALYYELAAAIASSWGISAAFAARLREQVGVLPALIAESLETTWSTAREHAKSVEKDGPLLVLGSGPNLANAHFLARKMFEVTQTTALSQEAEEYAHDEISIVDARMSVVQFVAPDAALSRSLEILDSVLTLGCSTAIVTERRAIEAIDQRVAWVYELAPGLDPLMTAPLYALPASVFTYELARLRGGSYYASDDHLHDMQGDRLIYGSQMLDD